jgi:NTE family protein
VIIAVNLNGDLLGRRFEREPKPSAAAVRAPIPNETLGRMLPQLPEALREQATQMIRRLLPQGSGTPGYFDVIVDSINIMSDQITRTRLAGEPPHVMLVPRLRDIELLEFNRASEAIAEGRACVEHALPMLRRYV